MKKVFNLVINSFVNDSRVLKSSLSLAGFGFDVKVVALHAEGLSRQEVVEGIHVLRLKLLSKSWPKWRIVQIFKYVEFAVRTITCTRQADFIHCNDLGALPIGVVVKLLFRKARLIYDAHEYECEMNGLKPLEKWIRKRVESSLIDFADEIITVSPAIAQEYALNFKIKEPLLVLNCPQYSPVKVSNKFREEFDINSNVKIFLYQGAMTYGRGIEKIIEFFLSTPPANAVLVCMGSGGLAGMAKDAMAKSSTVYYREAVSPQILMSYTGSADFGLCLIEDTCLSYRYCLPNKLFEYVMAGIPVLVSNLPELRRVVENWKLGMVISSIDSHGLKVAFEAAMKADGYSFRDGLENASKKYCWEEQEKVLSLAYRVTT